MHEQTVTCTLQCLIKFVLGHTFVAQGCDVKVNRVGNKVDINLFLGEGRANLLCLDNEAIRLTENQTL